MLVQLPSVIVDTVAEDFLDATAGSVLSTPSATFALADGDTLSLKIDGGATQLFTFNDVDFVDISVATLPELLAVLNASLAGGTASADTDRLRISSSTMGAASSVQILSQPTGVFGFSTVVHSGSNASAQVLLINRIPEPGEHEVPLDDDIAFEIFVAGGLAPVLGDLQVLINGLIVINAGVAVSGWSFTSSNPDASTLRVVLDPVDLFTGDGDVVVEVTAPSVSLDATYTFHSFDDVQPSTLRAQARAQKTIRVLFSEAVQQFDLAASEDALNPANYLIERVSVPAVALQVVSVAPVSSSEVDLMTDIEMTFGAQYELTVINVQDIAGNAHIPAPDNVVPFDGFVPHFPEGRRFLLQDAIPKINLSEDAQGDLRMFLAVLQEVTNVLLSDIDAWSDIIDLDVAEERFLDAMLADGGNPFGDFGLAEVDKRRLLRVLVRFYQLKGTRPGMVAAVLFFTGITVQVELYTGTGWELGDNTFDGDELSELEDGDPPALLGPDRHGLYSFRIISPVDLTDAQREMIHVIAEYMKVAHEHYLGTVEPTLVAFDHLELDFSELGEGTFPGSFVMH